MRKYLAVLFLVCVLVFSIFLPALAEEVTLRMAWWGSQDRHDRTLKVIRMFEEENPGINIEPEFLGFDGYWEKMAAQVAGGNLPDIWQHGYGLITRYIDRGLLMDLSEYVEKGMIDPAFVHDTVVR